MMSLLVWVWLLLVAVSLLSLNAVIDSSRIDSLRKKVRDLERMVK